MIKTLYDFRLQIHILIINIVLYHINSWYCNTISILSSHILVINVLLLTFENAMCKKIYPELINTT